MGISKTLDQSRTIVYENKLVTWVDWASKDVTKGTIKIKILGRKTYMTVDYNELKNVSVTKIKK